MRLSLHIILKYYDLEDTIIRTTDCVPKINDSSRKLELIRIEYLYEIVPYSDVHWPKILDESLQLSHIRIIYCLYYLVVFHDSFSDELSFWIVARNVSHVES